MSLGKFETVTLADVSINNKGEYGIGASAVDYSDELYTYLRITDINDDGTLNKNDLKSVDDDDAKNYLLNENDVVFARTGNSTGKAYYYDKMDGELVYAGFLIKFSLDPSKINPKFMKYYVLSEKYKGWVNSMCTGSTRPNINAKMYGNMQLILPPREQQDFLVNILDKIDKKIEINKRINKNLQKQINILFKSFFINFEFYDGKYQETLFGEIPIEWNIILFKDILNERNEKSTNQDIPMYSVTLDGIQPRADIYKKKITAKTTKFKIIHKYDLIFGMPNSGYQYGIMYDEIGGVSSAYPVFEINGIQPRYVDLFIKNISNYFNDIVKSGSRMGQGIDKKVLLSKEIYVPPNEHLDKYYSIESKLLDLINHNLTEINNLTKLRDTLLPKLMSGEIDITKINCDLELKYNYMKYLFNQIHTPMSKSVV